MDKFKRGMTDSMKTSINKNFLKVQRASKVGANIQSRLEASLEKLDNIQFQVRELKQFYKQKESKQLIKSILENIDELKSYLTEQQTDQVMVMGNREEDLEMTAFILQNCVVQMLIQNPFQQKEKNEMKKFYEKKEKLVLKQIGKETIEDTLESVGKF